MKLVNLIVARSPSILGRSHPIRQFIAVMSVFAVTVGLVLYLVGWIVLAGSPHGELAAVSSTLWGAYLAIVVSGGAIAWVLLLTLGRSGLPAEMARDENAAHSDEVAELKRAKEAAEFASAAKTRYLVSVGHEIRSPLNAIYGYAQLLEREGAVSTAEAGGVIRRSAEHLGNLVEGLLEVSRIESGVVTVRSDIVPLPAFLDHVMDMFRMQAEAKGLTFNYVVKGRLPRLVRTDEKRLRQILINLLSNAIKYTRAGSVTLTISYRSQVADIEVTDTGIGIAPEDLETIFEPFARGSSPEAQLQPGIGLGLAITRVLARILGGEIFVSSAPGDGSRFQLRMFLPEPNTVPAGTAEYRPVSGYEGARKTVLVIDDDPAQTSALVSLLRPLGFEVFTAFDGSEGLVLADCCTPDIVLLDIQMPGLSGWEAACRLRAAHGTALRIIMVSANAHEFRVGDEDRSSHDAFLAKPVDLQALLDVIGQQLQLEWRFAGDAPAKGANVVSRLPDSAAPLVETLRQLAKVGHVRGIEAALNQLETDVPESASVVSAMRNHVSAFDLRSLMKLLDDVDPR